MATLLPSRLTSRPTPRADWRGRLPRVEIPRVEVPALKSLPLPLRPRRKQRPVDRLSALVTRQVTRPATHWWGSRSRAQRISTVALGISGTAALLGVGIWGGARLFARRQARLAALSTLTVLPVASESEEATEDAVEATSALAEEMPAVTSPTAPAR